MLLIPPYHSELLENKAFFREETATLLPDSGYIRMLFACHKYLDPKILRTSDGLARPLPAYATPERHFAFTLDLG